ncbi:Type I restriction-modification system, specificity subunit S [Enhydrobacter sp. 8BJ]|nr:restriction endonuclease subunit S [Enhydrobacter sp. 8BJ]VXB37237.1 Type I restriction-modification system, specificity subunit S [Enhydrobacter sp. 8BJ]
MNVKTSLEMSNDISKPEQLITEHIDIWTSAILAKSSSGRGSSKRYELYGITKLRELILELAVRGKLVPQDTNDEPVSIILKKINDKKSELIKNGDVKVRSLPKITDEEVISDLPVGWKVIRLGNAMNVLNGRAYKKHEMLQEGTPLLRVGNLFTSKEWYYSDLELEPDKYINNGDLIYAWSASFGPFIWEGDKVIYHYHIWKLDLYDDTALSKAYLYNYLLSITKKIKASGNGIAMIHMTKGRMEELILPIPPLEEQKRIVAKVDELMLLCDQLEQQTEVSIEAHATLVKVLLSTLTDSADADELAQNWARIAEHFDSLFTTEQSIEALKKTVLQLAVMGKLVPQNPEDETASVLLEKIAEEKERLIKDKVIKKEKPLPAITDDEKPFELQTGWVWGRVNDIAHLKGGFAYKSKEFLDVGTYQVIRMGNIRPDNLRLDKNSVYIPEGLAESTQDYRINTGDILLTMTGTNGKEDYLYSLVVLDTHLLDQQLYLNQRLCRLRPILMNVDFLNIALKEPQLKKPIFNQSTGSANQANIGMGVISHWVLPVPPLAEQHRIVSKVDELMAICDQLKQKLKQSQETQVQLTDALIDRALG